MTGLSHLFENFGHDLAETAKESGPTEDDLADATLASFESGYTSGWDDAIKAHKDGQIVLSAALKECLARATLAKQDAFDAFLTSSETLIEGIVTQVLPQMSQDVLGQHVREILSKTLIAGVEQDIVLSVSAEEHETLVKLSAEWLPQGARIVSDPSLEPGQADLSLGASETHIDLAQVVRDVRQAVTAFFHVAKENASDDG